MLSLKPINDANPSWHYIAALLITTLLASMLIVSAAGGDLWMDEIWSIAFAREAQSVADIFVKIKHHNNHHLNTIFLYLTGERESLFVYRLFSVSLGIGSVLLIGYLAAVEWGYQEALLSMILTGISYPLLLYFSEARGYAPAIFFALTSYALLRLNSRQYRGGRVALFWVASILGILSNATFIIVTASLCLGSLVHEVNATRKSRQESLRFLITHHTPPILFFACWYLFILKDARSGGGPVYSYWEVLAQGSAFLLGLPEIPSFLIAALPCVLCAAAAGVLLLQRERNSQWLFYFAILCLIPASLLIATRPKQFYFRYFILCFPFFYLLLSHIISACWRAWPDRRRWFLLIGLTALLAVHATRDYRLLKFGRGDYSAALRYIAENSGTGVVHVGSDHDFKNRALFDFYISRISNGKKIRYINKDKWQTQFPDWIITHSQDVSYMPSKTLTVEGIGSYALVNVYRFSGTSGWNWYLFQRL